MGKIYSGILGNFHGKVGNVVGAKWKGIGYMRLYVIPSNPQTPSQVIQRDRLAFLMAHARMNKASLIDYGFGYSTKSKNMSPINRFMQLNLKGRDPIADFAGTKFSEGPVAPLGLTSATYNSTTEELVFDGDPMSSGYGSGDDQLIMAVVNNEDEVADLIFAKEDNEDRTTAESRYGTVMYKILSSKKKDGTTGTSYLVAFMMNSAGECSETEMVEITYTS